MAELDFDDLSATSSEAAKMRADDADLRRRTGDYNKQVLPYVNISQDLYSVLRRGSREDGTLVSETEVVPLLREYVDARIKESEAKVENPYDRDDLRDARLNLEHFEDIKASGLDGLSSYCLQQMDGVPRRIIDDQIDDYWKPLFERWSKYKAIIDAQVGPNPR